MKNVLIVLGGKATSHDNKISEDLIADDTDYIKFASMTTVDVKRCLPTM